MKGILVAGFVLLASVAQAAIVWTVTKPTDCTAAQTPSGCCVVASPGANPACQAKQNFGSTFQTRVDLRSDGGAYTVGGDQLSSTATGLIGINTVQWMNCWASNGMDVVPIIDLTGKVIKMKLFTTANTEMTAAAIATSIWLTCDVFGH